MYGVMSEQQPNKTVLSIDTAMSGVSVGVNATNGHTVSRMIETARGQAAILVPTIQEALSEAQITFADVELIVTTIGPGSFTGLRIGLATARSLSLALDVPIVGLNTLDVMARHYVPSKPLLVVLETKRQDFYARFYDTDYTPLSEPFSGEAEMILKRAPHEDFVVGGDCLERFQVSVSDEMALLDNWMQPDPILIAQYGLSIFHEQGASERVDPLYLRGADVSQSNKKIRILEA